MINWKGYYSEKFRVSAGVRQGGCLSPILFSINVNTLIVSIRNSNSGCHVKMLNLGIIMYADDIVLVSASLVQLQKLVDVCITELKNWI